MLLVVLNVLMEKKCSEIRIGNWEFVETCGIKELSIFRLRDTSVGFCPLCYYTI